MGKVTSSSAKLGLRQIYKVVSASFHKGHQAGMEEKSSHVEGGIKRTRPAIVCLLNEKDLRRVVGTFSLNEGGNLRHFLVFTVVIVEAVWNF